MATEAILKYINRYFSNIDSQTLQTIITMKVRDWNLYATAKEYEFGRNRNPVHFPLNYNEYDEKWEDWESILTEEQFEYVKHRNLFGNLILTYQLYIKMREEEKCLV